MRLWAKLALWQKILIGLALGVVIGLTSPGLTKAITPLGDIFLRMLKMLIVPLVFSTVTNGICKMGDVRQLRIVGGRFLAWIVLSAVIAAAVGVALGLMFQPGRGTTDFLAAAPAADAAQYSFIDNIVSWFPTNIVESMASGSLLHIIVFSLFLGIALLALGERASGLVRVIDEVCETVLKITEYVIAFTPFGILSLIATMVSTVSGAAMKEVLLFILLDNVGAAVVLLLVYPVTVRCLGKVSGLRFMKKVSPALLVAISTTSSAATLPVSIKLANEELGIPENIYGFTLPLGNTCGMSGFALFIGLCCIFASNLYGFPVTVATVAQFIFFGMILSIGAAGVKGAGIVMSGVLLEALGMPLTLVPILAAIWPVIDAAHTVLNNAGDLAGTTVIARQMDKMDMAVFNG